MMPARHLYAYVHLVRILIFTLVSHASFDAPFSVLTFIISLHHAFSLCYLYVRSIRRIASSPLASSSLATCRPTLSISCCSGSRTTQRFPQQLIFEILCSLAITSIVTIAVAAVVVTGAVAAVVTESNACGVISRFQSSSQR